MRKENYIKESSDLEIVAQYKATNDKELVGELFKRYTRFVFLVCMKYYKDEEKSKDACSQIFENLFKDLKKHEIRNFKSWLHTVAKNHCLLQIRGSKPGKRFEEELIKEHKNNMESGNILYLNDESDKEIKLRVLEDAISTLSKEQKICIELFYLREKCYDEVSEITGYSFKKVKSHIQNGKRNLRNFLEK